MKKKYQMGFSMNPRKKDKSKYKEHHSGVGEYPKLFWNSKVKGTYRRVTK